MIKTLILKDWYFQRNPILLAFAGGAISLGIVCTGSQAGFTIGLILLVTVMVMISAMTIMGNVLGERENQTLAFAMTLPISYLEYTTAKILGNLLIFVPFWLTMLAGSLALIVISPPIHGFFAFAIIMAVEILVSTCLMLVVALVTESKPWSISAMITGNLALNVVGYLVAHLPGIKDGLFGTQIYWTQTATISLAVEFALIALLIGGAFHIQSRKRDFI
jgi:ABC-type transport system involved in multi-copper enzyme maturation permease subunit